MNQIQTLALENLKAEDLVEAIALIKNWNYVPVACWYELVDRSANDNSETRYGLFDFQQKIKPAGEAFIHST